MNKEHHHGEHSEPAGCHGDECNVVAKPEQTVALNSQAIAEALTTVRVEGMDCADEVEALRRALEPVAGIREFKVSLRAGKVTIAHEKKLSTEDLIRAVGKAGLKAHTITGEHEQEASGSGQCARLIAVIVSGLVTGLGLRCSGRTSPRLTVASLISHLPRATRSRSRWNHPRHSAVPPSKRTPHRPNAAATIPRRNNRGYLNCVNPPQ